MSYVRWSDDLPITERCPECGREPAPEPPPEGTDESIEWFLDRHDEREQRMKAREQQGLPALCPACTSPWYVLWHSDSGTTRESQVLAVWSVHSEDAPVYDYEQIRSIVDRDAWSELDGFDKSGDPYGMLSDSLRDWLAEVEEAYP